MQLKVFLICVILFFNAICLTVNAQQDTGEINLQLQAMASGKLPFDSALKMIPKIIKQAEHINYKKGIASAYLTKGIALYRTGKLNEAVMSYEMSLLYRDTVTEKKEISRTYNNMALAYADQSLYDEALYSHKRALKIRQQNKDTGGVAASVMNIGLLYELQGKYDLSQANYFESLKIRETIHDSDGIASCLNNIGTSFFYLNNTKKALEYYSKSSEISIRRSNVLDMAKSYGNLAMVYDHIKKYDQAIVYYEKALAMFVGLNNPFNIATCYNNIALVYNNLLMKDKAIEYHLKSLEIKEQIGDKTGMATSYLNLGNIFLDKKNTGEAKPYFSKGLNLSLSSGNKILIMNAYKGLSELYRQKGDYKNCFTNYQLYEAHKDSLNNLEKLAKISELEGMYNTEKKEIEILTKDNELKSQMITIEKRKNYLIISGLVLLAVIVFAIQLFVANKRTSKLNARLLNKISENELLISEINHRTKNNLQLVSGLLKLPQKHISAESAKEVMSATRDRVNAIAIIHNLLYDRKSATTIEAKKYFGELCNSLINNLSANHIIINTDIDDVVLDVDTVVPLGLVANELLTNAIKHAFENVNSPELTVKLKFKGNELELLIADNGRMDATKILNADKKSFGIKMINLLAAQIKAEFTYYFQSGMNFSFRFKH